MSSDFYETLTNSLLGTAPEVEVSKILAEGYELENESTIMSYLFRVEQLFDDNDVYLFDGWIDGEVIGPPDIGKFWITTEMRFPKELDLEGAARIIGKDKKNFVGVKKLDDGSYMLKIKILRHELDDMERDNRLSAARNARLFGEPGAAAEHDSDLETFSAP